MLCRLLTKTAPTTTPPPRALEPQRCGTDYSDQYHDHFYPPPPRPPVMCKYAVPTIDQIDYTPRHRHHNLPLRTQGYCLPTIDQTCHHRPHIFTSSVSSINPIIDHNRHHRHCLPPRDAKGACTPTWSRTRNSRHSFEKAVVQRKSAPSQAVHSKRY